MADVVCQILEGRPSEWHGWESWRTFLVNKTTGAIKPLEPSLTGGATAVGNPSVSFLTLPDGRPAVAFASFIFTEGRQKTPAGPHLSVYALGP